MIRVGILCVVCHQVRAATSKFLGKLIIEPECLACCKQRFQHGVSSACNWHWYTDQLAGCL